MVESQLQALDAQAVKNQLIQAVVIVRNGYLVHEEYYGRGRDRKRETARLGESVLALAVGIALDQGRLESVDQKILSFYPEAPSAQLDPRVQEITVRHLLTHTSGLWQASGVNRLNFPGEHTKTVEVLFGLELRADPGSEFVEDPAPPSLVSGAITATTGSTLAEFVQQNLFDPLGVADVLWIPDGSGNSKPVNLWMNPTDVAKLGYLVLRNGRWDGRQVVSESWLAEMLSPHVDDPAPFVYGSRLGLDRFLEDFNSFGCGWWLGTVEGQRCWCALGYQSNFLFVLPDMDLVVGVMGRAGSAADMAGVYDLLPYIIEAAR